MDHYMANEGHLRRTGGQLRREWIAFAAVSSRFVAMGNDKLWSRHAGQPFAPSRCARYTRTEDRFLRSSMGSS